MKNLSDRTYWHNFGRGAVGRASLPTPQEAADTVLSLMERIAKLEAELTETRHLAKCALQPIELLALTLQNQLDEIRANVRVAIKERT